MADQRMDKLADLLVNYSIGVRPGEKILLHAPTPAEPFVTALYREVLKAGGFPYYYAIVPEFEPLLYRYGNQEQIEFIPPALTHAMETFDARIRVICDPNTKALSSSDPDKIVMRRRAEGPLLRTLMERTAAGSMRWTVALFPTHGHAQNAEMSTTEFEDFVYRACMPDENDPIGHWQKVSAQQDRIVQWLKGKKHVHVTAPGTDLRLSVAGRTFENCDGHMNMPDGEVFTGPVEDSVEGMVSFTYPAIYHMREVQGVRLWFEKGKVVKAQADKGEDYLVKTLDTDAGARYVGEFAIGTNDGITRFTREILFDEKIGGSFHMAMGSGYPETGSKNDSAIHWDMICDLRQGGQITVDGQLMCKDGNFVI
jgi:aminopeptidase